MADDQSIRGLIEDLSNAALRDLLRNVRHHTELRRRIAAGMVDERWVNQEYREYARREGPSYRQQAADLTMQYYSDLTELGNQYSDRFYREMLDGVRPFGPESGNGDHGAEPREAREVRDPAAGAAAGAGAEVEQIPIELHGPPGREVVARFGLENTETHSVSLSLEVGVCTGPDDAPFYAPLTVQPAHVSLQPGESRQITLRLLMLPSVFVPGYLYRLPVTVRGADELRLDITIWAEEPDAGAGVDATAPTPAATRPAVEEPPAEPAAETPPSPTVSEQFIVRCPACQRDFERGERTNRLYPHKRPDGEPCSARSGRVRKARS